MFILHILDCSTKCKTSKILLKIFFFTLKLYFFLYSLMSVDCVVLVLSHRKLWTLTVVSWWPPCRCLQMQTLTLWRECWVSWSLRSSSLTITSFARGPWVKRCTSFSMEWPASSPNSAKRWSSLTDPTLEVSSKLTNRLFPLFLSDSFMV